MQIKDYQERSAAIIRRDGDWLRAFVGDALPAIGEALKVCSQEGDSVFAVVRRHVGGREVDALLLDAPDWVEAGCAVEPSGQNAHIPRPAPGVTRFDKLAISPAPQNASGADNTFSFRPRELDFAELNGQRPALPTGFDPVDHLAPIASAGFNLVLDASPNAAAFDTVCERIAQAGTFDARLRLGGSDPSTNYSADHAAERQPADRQPDWPTHQLQLAAQNPRQLTALRVLTNWAAHLRDQGQDLLVCADLPPLSAPEDANSPEDTALGTSIGEVIDLLGGALSSTNTATITTLIRLPLHDSAAGIDAIIETMSLGEVDAQVFVDADSRFEPTRSTSRAQLDSAAQTRQQRLLSLLNRAAAARDKAALWGEFGVDDAELRAIDEAKALQIKLTN